MNLKTFLLVVACVCMGMATSYVKYLHERRELFKPRPGSIAEGWNKPYEPKVDPLAVATFALFIGWLIIAGSALAMLAP